MKIYKIAQIKRFAEIRGEWWLIDGEPMFADGDTGDINHEGMVINHIYAQYDIDPESYVSDIDQINSVISNSKNLITDEQIDKFSEDYGMDENFIRDVLRKIEGITEDEKNVLSGWMDARDYGLKHLGWIRVKGNNIETWIIDDSTLREIANGMYDAANMEEEELEQEEFYIDVISTRTTYSYVPWSILSSGSIVALNAHREAKY